MHCTRIKAILKLQRFLFPVRNLNDALVKKRKWEYFSSQNKYLIKTTYPRRSIKTKELSI